MDWAKDIVQRCQSIAQALDATQGGQAHQQAWQAAACALADPTLLPSARVVAAMQAQQTPGHVAFSLAQSAQTHAVLTAPALPAQVLAQFEQQALASLQDQAAIEAADTLPFEAFRQDYMSSRHLQV